MRKQGWRDQKWVDDSQLGRPCRKCTVKGEKGLGSASANSESSVVLEKVESRVLRPSTGHRSWVWWRWPQCWLRKCCWGQSNCSWGWRDTGSECQRAGWNSPGPTDSTFIALILTFAGNSPAHYHSLRMPGRLISQSPLLSATPTVRLQLSREWKKVSVDIYFPGIDQGKWVCTCHL